MLSLNFVFTDKKERLCIILRNKCLPMEIAAIKILFIPSQIDYRSGTVNSKSFLGKVLLRIKWKFELTYAL